MIQDTYVWYKPLEEPALESELMQAMQPRLKGHNPVPEEEVA